jgi:hypothetical protein
MIIETSDGQGNVISRIDDGVPVQPDLPSPQVVAAQAMHDEISSRLAEATTINAVKLAITEGLDAAILTLQGEG